MNRLKQAGFFIPFTLYFVLFTVAAALALSWLQNANNDPGGLVPEVFSLLITVTTAFTVSFVGIALLSVIVSYVYFIIKRRKNLLECEIDAELKDGELHQKQTVRLVIRPVLKPFFGFVKLRLQYGKDQFSAKFSLLENSRLKFFDTTIKGTYNWPLPEIKEYHVESAILYFEDVFHFFSIAVSVPANSRFITQPGEKNIKQLRVLPRKTEDTNNRIEELRRVDGEYLNYKNFEDNDDVRRIVWKIYARNKELVVRIPEIMDPYASHIYLYASFFTRFNVNGNTVADVPFLNYYKVLTWSVYRNLAKQGFEVRFIPDQEHGAANTLDEELAVKYNISTSMWQTDKDLRSYCKTNDAALVLISSFSDPEQVQELLNHHGSDIKFIFVKLTESLQKHHVMDWLKWIFVQNEKDDIEVYKTSWRISPLRSRVIQNEKQLEEMIKKYEMEEV